MSDVTFTAAGLTVASPEIGTPKLMPWAVTPSVGSTILYRAATGMERAAADLDGDRITAVPAELIRDSWDPEKCPIDILQYLSWAMGVEYWNDEWSETTKRQWTKVQWLFKSQRGTANALRMAVDYAGRDISRWGYEVGKITTRPQQVFSGPSLTKAEREAWLSSLPQVRSWRVQEEGTALEYKAFLNASNSLRLRNYRFCLVPSTRGVLHTHGLTVAGPEIGMPSITCAHVLTATSLTVGVPELGTPTITV